MTPEQAGGHPSQFRVARGEAKQRGQLQTGIPQPHGRDVAGIDKGVVVAVGLSVVCSGLQRVGKAVPEHPGQPGIVL